MNRGSLIDTWACYNGAMETTGFDSYTALEFRVETPTDVIYFTSREGDLPERWLISNMLRNTIGELVIDRGYANVYVDGTRVFQNDASAASDHFDDNDRRVGALKYIAANIYDFKA